MGLRPVEDAAGGAVVLADAAVEEESFEGELEAGAYDRMVQQTQQYIADQTAQILRSFSWFLPGSSKRSADRD